MGLVAAGAMVGLVGSVLTVAIAPAAPVHADTNTREAGVGFYRNNDASWHVAYDTPPGSESDASFLYGPADQGNIVAVSGDWNGNGSTSVGYYQYSNATWHLSNDLSGGASDISFQWGIPGNTDIQPVVGDWNGDGKDTVGWYRPSDASWHLAASNTATTTSTTFAWGLVGNTSVRAIAGDWDGDGKSTVGWYRPSDATWHEADSNTTSPTSTSFQWGIAGDSSIKPLVGDWNGNGTSSVGWYRPSDASWHLTNTNAAGATSFANFTYGPAGSASIFPIAGDWDGKVTASPVAPGLPSNPTADQTVQYARSFLGQHLGDIRPKTTGQWSGYSGNWCAWFATWVIRNATGGRYEAWVPNLDSFGPTTTNPQVGDLVVFGDHHVGIVSKRVNGTWFLIDGNGGTGPWANSVVAERAIWSESHHFIHISY